MATKKVLLARPHAFIVNQMRPFLIDAGYLPVGARDLDHLQNELGPSLKGAIISTAVTSTVAADATTVFRLVRTSLPRLPVIFVGMADAATMRVVAERAVKDLIPNPVFTGPADYRPGMDRATTFLIMRKDDLLEPSALELATRALCAHLG